LDTRDIIACLFTKCNSYFSRISWKLYRKYKRAADRPKRVPAKAKGAPAKAFGLCGERRSQDTGEISRLREMEHCVLCFDESGHPAASAFLCIKVPKNPGSCGYPSARRPRCRSRRRCAAAARCRRTGR